MYNALWKFADKRTDNWKIIDLSVLFVEKSTDALEFYNKYDVLEVLFAYVSTMGHT